MPRLTTRGMNKALAAAGYKLELHQGRGYLYFAVSDATADEWMATDGATHETYKVDVCWLNHLTQEQWMNRAQEANAAIWPADEGAAK